MPHRSNRTSGMRRVGTARFAAASVLILVVFALSRWGPQKLKWALTQGTIQDTRIVPEHALETKWGSQLTWKAEYRVSYTVAGREYTVWADSGIRGESEAGVRMVLPESRPPCRVRYDTARPETAVTDCH
ncbi:MAG: DUF3592 domain-containing protein [Terriglobales bacterium]